jgi:hypothetical protein
MNAEASEAEMASELKDAQVPRDALPPRPPQCNAVLTGGDVQRIVAPLREKVDAMQKQIEKYKDRERTLVEANEVLQQSALRKECR